METVPQAVTTEDLIRAVGGEVPAEKETVTVYAPLPEVEETSTAWKPKKLPWWRKVLAVLSGGTALYIFWQATQNTNLGELFHGSNVSVAGWETLKTYGIFLLSLVVMVAAIGRRSKTAISVTRMQKQKLSKRTLVAAVLILLCIPATLWTAVRFWGNSNYYLTALVVLAECMLPFFMVFEGRHPQARELVIIAVLCALGVAGRAVFFMLPQFKPIMALTIISGVALGGETGFLVGAITMLASNVLFSQGPWTPFQMFAMGIIGFLAGVLFRKGLLRRSRGALCVFGAIVTFAVYGALMNPLSALVWSRELQWELLATYYLTGFPADCVHAASTVFFLWVAAEPMLEKLDRIKVKYGLME